MLAVGLVSALVAAACSGPDITGSVTWAIGGHVRRVHVRGCHTTVAADAAQGLVSGSIWVAHLGHTEFF